MPHLDKFKRGKHQKYIRISVSVLFLIALLVVPLGCAGGFDKIVESVQSLGLLQKAKVEKADRFTVGASADGSVGAGGTETDAEEETDSEVGNSSDIDSRIEQLKEEEEKAVNVEINDDGTYTLYLNSEDYDDEEEVSIGYIRVRIPRGFRITAAEPYANTFTIASHTVVSSEIAVGSMVFRRLSFDDDQMESLYKNHIFSIYAESESRQVVYESSEKKALVVENGTAYYMYLTYRYQGEAEYYTDIYSWMILQEGYIATVTFDVYDYGEEHLRISDYESLLMEFFEGINTDPIS